MKESERNRRYVLIGKHSLLLILGAILFGLLAPSMISAKSNFSVFAGLLLIVIYLVFYIPMALKDYVREKKRYNYYNKKEN